MITGFTDLVYLYNYNCS